MKSRSPKRAKPRKTTTPSAVAITGKGGKSRGAPADAREKLVTQGVKLFARQGYEATTTRQIAAAAKLNVSLISYYFGGKEGLYRAAIEGHASRVNSRVDALLQMAQAERAMTREDVEQILRALCESTLQSHLDYPDMKIMLFRELSSGMRHARAYLEQTFHPIVDGLRKVLAQAQAQGVVRRDLDPLLFLMMMIHTLDMVAVTSRSDMPAHRHLPQLPRDREALVENVLSVMLRGGLA